MISCGLTRARCCPFEGEGCDKSREITAIDTESLSITMKVLPMFWAVQQKGHGKRPKCAGVLVPLQLLIFGLIEIDHENKFLFAGCVDTNALRSCACSISNSA